MLDNKKGSSSDSPSEGPFSLVSYIRDLGLVSYGNIRYFTTIVPKRGLEPPPGCPDQTLNLARLPIPPLRHDDFRASKYM
jgi:hypothetical protein